MITKKILSRISITIFFISLFFITACEDDALLTPQNDSECVGSYCSLNIPGSKQTSQILNPKTF